MMERVDEAARAAGGDYDKEPLLVDENASLVEEPHVVTGCFDRPSSRSRPRSSARSRAGTSATSACRRAKTSFSDYLAVVNTANRPDSSRRGTDRVMRARLADARFFWKRTRRRRSRRAYDKLAGIVFHNRLGTVKEKAQRIERPWPSRSPIASTLARAEVRARGPRGSASATS